MKLNGFEGTPRNGSVAPRSRSASHGLSNGVRLAALAAMALAQFNAPACTEGNEGAQYNDVSQTSLPPEDSRAYLESVLAGKGRVLGKDEYTDDPQYTTSSSIKQLLSNMNKSRLESDREYECGGATIRITRNENRSLTEVNIVRADGTPITFKRIGHNGVEILVYGKSIAKSDARISTYATNDGDTVVFMPNMTPEELTQASDISYLLSQLDTFRELAEIKAVNDEEREIKIGDDIKRHGLGLLDPPKATNGSRELFE